MSVIKINAITVPAETGDELAVRFRERQARGAMQNIPGFEGFELFQPADEREQWLVVTRWESDQAFTSWQNSEEFRKAHERTEDENGQKKKPVGTHAELWSYVPAAAG
ncbi:antibiotic biosynthesis monooxygenase family protein [Nesterenkonia flava]|uniref:Antibiotic biosynthesis monooxygenase n=1 Tax=Nesterenkonia flava TaxID=469799 RepID=A0ABU1FU24_9MICC|nr:antibiotic biosynthesis monooxygenase [Nesterenkonia flava]MDR5712164.1 antibiotic biosynthesis monooxygenase [Nesterenkonia flava]